MTVRTLDFFNSTFGNSKNAYIMNSVNSAITYYPKFNQMKIKRRTEKKNKNE